MSDKLVSYIKKGIKQGFNTEYIRKVLIKHGHSEAEVDMAIGAAGGEQHQQNSQKRSPTVVGWIALAIAAVIVLFLLSALLESQMQNEKLETEVTVKDQQVQEYMDQVADLSERIDLKERTIDQQIKELQGRGTSEHEELLLEIQSLHSQIREERKEVNTLLLDLLEEIIGRYNPKEVLTRGEYNAEFEDERESHEEDTMQRPIVVKNLNGE